jgi:hypothetical protein
LWLPLFDFAPAGENTGMSRGETVRAEAIGADLFCPRCGYNVRGIDSQRCPECGGEVDRGKLSASRIPWVHRREIGRFRAYWRTVAMVVRRPREVAGEVARPVSLSDARRFWVATVVWAFLPLAMVGTWWVFGSGRLAFAGVYGVNSWQGLRGLVNGGSQGPTWRLPISAADWVWVVSFWVGLFLFLLFSAGVASYWFHAADLPVVQQNRAVAVSYYACAPLAWVGIALAVMLVAGWWNLIDPRGYVPLFWRRFWIYGLLVSSAAGLATAGGVVWWWVVASVMLKRATRCGLVRVIAAAVGLPVAWVALALLTVVAIPYVVGLIELMVLSRL